MLTRSLGTSGISVSALGLGCWAIGGPFWKGAKPVGWGQVDDRESIRAIHRAVELGITFFDTADIYGCGHSERVLGQALVGRRDQVVIATKFGQTFDEATRQGTGYDVTPEHIRRACDASLRRLNIDVIDLYQLHVKDVDLTRAKVVRDTLEGLVAAGKIRWYGWSTDDPASARAFAEGAHCTAIQQRLNVFEGNFETLAICEQFNLASINRSPLAMGLLTGKFTVDTQFPADDVRSGRYDFKGAQADTLRRFERIRNILCADGRSSAQAALGWLWARSGKTIPIPGFRNVEQVEENAGALHWGPLQHNQMKQIESIISKP